MKQNYGLSTLLAGIMAVALLLCGCTTTADQDATTEVEDISAQQIAEEEEPADSETDESQQAEPETLAAGQTTTYLYGNTAGNIYNRGTILMDGYGIAYLYNMYTETVCKTDMKTGLTTTLYDGLLYYMNSGNNTIYAYDSAENAIVSIGCYTGITSTLLSPDFSVDSLLLVNDTLYFCSSDGQLYSMSTAGGEAQLLLSEAYYPQVYQNLIIYQNNADQESLYSLNLTDGEITKLNDSHSHFPIPYQDVVYYVRVEDDDLISICSVPLDGSGQESVVLDSYGTYLNIYGDTLYYLNDSWLITSLDLTDPDAQPATLELDGILSDELKAVYGDSSVSSLSIVACEAVNLCNGYIQFGCYEIINDISYFDEYLYDLENNSIIVLEAFCLDLDGALEEILTLLEESTSTVSDSSGSSSASSSGSTRTSYPSGNYSVGSVYGPKLTQTELDEVADAVEKFLATYDTASMDDYTKVLTAHDYLCSVCSYAASWSQNGANTAWGALVYGEAQCSGYARAMKALCDAMGVGCYYVHADENASNPSHQWNQVCVNGNWYIVDVQCNDSSGFKAFFLVSDSTYQAGSGMSWDTDAYPACPNDY